MKIRPNQNRCGRGPEGRWVGTVRFEAGGRWTAGGSRIGVVVDRTGDSVEVIEVGDKLESVEETVGEQCVGAEFVREFVTVGLGKGAAWPVTVAALRKQVRAATSFSSVVLCHAVVFHPGLHPGQVSAQCGLWSLAKP